MEIFESIVMVLAGCGAFLIGFKLLSDNMEKIAGRSLKKLFNKTSDKKLVGVTMGAVSTAVVQSSGVTTVMVIGFVNAGIMSLKQAAAVIMGANIGTTITAQIAALKALPIEPIFMLLLFLGVMIDLFAKKDKAKSIGLALAGLGMVFLGLNVMSSAMEGYKDNPYVVQFLEEMTNPFLLLLFGIVFTALMQSSSAVTTILIGMASVGLVIGGGGNAVLYIILGSNIGSCVTALISSVGVSTNAKRASIIHLLFNLIGTLIFMTMLLIWKDFFPTTFGVWFKEPATQIAMFHTFFNIICTLLFLPFSGLLVKASELLVKDKKAEKKSVTVFINKSFLPITSVAIDQAKKETFRLFDMADESLGLAFDGFIQRDSSRTSDVMELNAKISELSSEISEFLVHISTQDSTVEDEKTVSALHTSVGDIVRISELADNITKYTKKSVAEELTFSAGVVDKIVEMRKLLSEQYETTKKIVLDGEKSLLSVEERIEEDVDALRKELVADHIARLARGECRPENNSVFINLVSNLERIGDHIDFVAHSIENA